MRATTHVQRGSITGTALIIGATGWIYALLCIATLLSVVAAFGAPALRFAVPALAFFPLLLGVFPGERALIDRYEQ